LLAVVVAVVDFLASILVVQAAAQADCCRVQRHLWADKLTLLLLAQAEPQRHKMLGAGTVPVL